MTSRIGQAESCWDGIWSFRDQSWCCFLSNLGKECWIVVERGICDFSLGLWTTIHGPGPGPQGGGGAEGVEFEADRNKRTLKTSEVGTNLETN